MKSKLKKNYIKNLISSIIIAVLLISSVKMIDIPITTAYADEAKIVSISADYTGESVLIGEDIDKSKLSVKATYENGDTEEIKDYTIVSTKVTQEGTNLLMVIYKGKTANFYVTGKKINTISVYYTGPIISIGNNVSKKDISVYVTYNDGSTGYLTDFKIVQNEIKTDGSNTIYVHCQNQVFPVTVYGTKPQSIAALYATYSGGKVPVGSSVNRDDLLITAAYKDGSTEIINNYVLLPEVIGSTGTQTIVANYNGFKVSFNVEGTFKELKELTAEYLGDPVGVGYTVRPSDVLVTGTYDDGTKEVIKEFNLLGSGITYVGYHVITVEVKGLKAEFIVQGVAEQVIDFSNSCDFSITNGTNTGKVSVALPSNVKKDDLKGSDVATATVNRVLSRAVRNSSFIAFEVEAVNEDIIEDFPLTMKITIPDEYKLENTSLYYTPNRKSVIGLLNIETVKPNVITATIYNPGTYILSYKEK